VGAVALGLAVELDLGSGGATPLWPRGAAGGAFVAVPFPILPHGSWLIIQRFQLTGWLAGGLGLGFGRVWLWLLVWFACHLALVLFFSAL